MSNYRSILRPVSTFNAFTSPIVDSGIKTLTVDISWVIKTSSDHNTAWKVWDGKIVSSSWSVQVIEEVDSSWSVQAIEEVDSSWKIWHGVVANILWKIKTLEEVYSSWRMPDLFNTAWKIFERKQQDTSWSVQAIEEVDSSWKIWHGVVANTSWRLRASTIVDISYVIFNLKEVDISWRLLNGLIVPISYKIQPAILFNTSWKLQEKTITDFSWKITRSPNGNVSWKILGTDDVLIGTHTHVAVITVDTVEIEPLSISISADIDSLAWVATLQLEDESDYDLCVASDSITVSIDNMSWFLNVKQQDKTMAFVNSSWQITAISPFGIISEEQVSLILENDSLVSVVAEAVAGSEMVFSWETVNWNIPAEIKIAENTKRGAVLNELIQSIDAELIAIPNGSLKVISGTPTEEQKTYPAAIWTTDDLLSINYDIIRQKVYKRVLTGSEALYIPRKVSISILEQDDENRTAIIGIWVAPEAVPPVLSDCGPGTINIITQQEVIETETETIVFTDGIATTGESIYSLESISWGGHTNLGSVIIVGSNQLLASVVGFSIAEVTYKIKYYRYIVTASGIDAVQTMVCAAVDPVRSDVIADCQRGSGVLSPEVLTHKFCTELVAAQERGRVYLDKHSEDAVSYSIEKIWDGCKLPDIGSVILLNGVLSKLISLDIKYTFPAVQLSATLEKIQ